MPWFELSPTRIINLDQTWHVQVSGNNVTYTSVGPQNTAFSINYGNPAAAQAAYAAFKLAAIPPVTPAPIQVGDMVRIRGDGNRRTQENVSYTVEAIPAPGFLWWALRGTNTNTLYILTLSSEIWLEKLP